MPRRSHRSARKSSRSRGSNYKVQSIVIPKSVMAEREAKQWIKKHYTLGKAESYANTWRFRQIAPETVKAQGYTHFKNKKLPNGVELVLAYKHPRKL